jgi:hypothetical protein
MDFLEKDLEEIIYNADRELLQEKGLYINGILKRQLRIGNYGIADLVEFEKVYNEGVSGFIPKLKITIYELKKDSIGISAFLQAVGYMKGLQSYFSKRKINYDINFYIVLIGKDIDKKSSFSYLTDFICSDYDGCLNSLSCKTYKYEIDGIIFKDESEYKLIDEGF